MKTKAKVIIALITAVAGILGSGAAYSFDFSTNISTSADNYDSSTNTTIIEGDTIINEIVEEVVDVDALYDIGEEIAMDILCDQEPDLDICLDWYN